MITFQLNSELAMFKDTAKDLAATEIRPKMRDAEDAQQIPADLEDRYHELGLAAVEVPENYGGLGQGLVGRIVVEEELANGDIGIALALPSPAPYVAAVLALGTDAQKEKLIPRAIES